jgi:hypothetical protein
MNGKMYLAPGHKVGESKEEGQKRRDKEYKARSREFLRRVREIEVARLNAAKAVIEEKLGGYEDRPL